MGVIIAIALHQQTDGHGWGEERILQCQVNRIIITPPARLMMAMCARSLTRRFHVHRGRWRTSTSFPGSVRTLGTVRSLDRRVSLFWANRTMSGVGRVGLRKIRDLAISRVV